MNRLTSFRPGDLVTVVPVGRTTMAVVVRWSALGPPEFAAEREVDGALVVAVELYVPLRVADADDLIDRVVLLVPDGRLAWVRPSYLKLLEGGQAR